MILYTFFARIISYHFVIYKVAYFIYSWSVILAIFGLGKRYMNFANRQTAYMSKSSFGVCLFHQQWIVIAAYFALMLSDNIILQMISILLKGIVFTFINYEVFIRIPVIRFMFGLKK